MLAVAVVLGVMVAMVEQEVLAVLNEAATVPSRRAEIWDQLQAEARGNADQLTLPDKVKLDGILDSAKKSIVDEVARQLSLTQPNSPLKAIADSITELAKNVGRDLGQKAEAKKVADQYLAQVFLLLLEVSKILV